jgi:hypothetical protein
MTTTSSFESRFVAKVTGNVYILVLPATLNSLDVELIKGGPPSSRADGRRGFVWDLRLIREQVRDAGGSFRGFTADSVGEYTVKCLIGVWRLKGHVVFMHGAEFVELFNRSMIGGPILENYETEGQAVAAVDRYFASCDQL